VHTILNLIEVAADAHPDSVAIRHRRSTITYRELSAGIDNVARNAVAAGARPGDRFIYAARPSPTSLAITLGLLRAGLTLVFVDPFTSPELFARRAELVNPRYTLADAVLYTVGHRRLASLRAWKGVNVCDYSAIDSSHLHIGRRLPGVPKRSVSMNRWLMRPAPQVPIPTLDANADAIITFTSGTTADPKGVVHTLASISANVVNFGNLLDLQPGQKVYSEPMTVGSVAISRGAEWHIPHQSDTIPDAAVYFAVPSEVIATLDRIDRGRHGDRTPTISIVATGGAPVLPALVDRISGTLGAGTTILNVYGMTEMLPIAVGDARRKAAVTRGDLLGRPIGDTRIRIADDNEIVVAGSGLMDRYFGHDRAEWHPTGDLGLIDDNGTLIMLGRKKNMFIRGNQNIYPSLYEPGLTTIDGVADAVLLGVADQYGDDRIVLLVVPAVGHNPEAVRRRVESEAAFHMDADAVPDLVSAIAVMPTTGRAQKRDMAALQRLAAELVGAAG
jgi:acyl-CoA synthetase (AMP-forming)/AMP-acid ligase II